MSNVMQKQTFVFVIPKGGLAGLTLPIEEYSCLYRFYFIVNVIPKEGLARMVQAKTSSGMTTTNFLIPVSNMAWLIQF